MKPVIAAIALALLAAGCNSSESQRDRILIGGGLGAATGAAIGAAAGSTGGAALAGAAIGAIGGGIIGAVTAPTGCIAKDPDGVLYRIPCP